VQLVSRGERPTVRTARVYLLFGTPTADELERVKKYVMNPVESRGADLKEKATLKQTYAAPDTVETLAGFTAMGGEALAAFVARYGLAMDAEDLAFCQTYFRGEHRDPTLTEIRMIDTYWSDHCRHTTFLGVRPLSGPAQGTGARSKTDHPDGRGHHRREGPAGAGRAYQSGPERRDQCLLHRDRRGQQRRDRAVADDV
jgi:hypothetical protein